MLFVCDMTSTRTRPLVLQLNHDLEQHVWVVRVENERGKVQEYRCFSEEQATLLSLVFAPPPQGQA